MGLRRFTPIGLPGLPFRAEPLDIGVAVLGDDRGHPLGMRHRQAQAGRRAVVENIQGVAAQAERVGEAIDELGESVERIGELSARRGFRVAEAGEVGRDHAVAIGEPGDQVAEHVRRGRKAVQQEQDRRVGGPGRAIEDVDVAHSDRLVRNAHGSIPTFHELVADGLRRFGRLGSRERGRRHCKGGERRRAQQVAPCDASVSIGKCGHWSAPKVALPQTGAPPSGSIDLVLKVTVSPAAMIGSADVERSRTTRPSRRPATPRARYATPAGSRRTRAWRRRAPRSSRWRGAGGLVGEMQKSKRPARAGRLVS